MKKVVLLLMMVMMQSYKVFAQSSVVAVTKQEIVAIDFEHENEVIILNKGKEFSTPRISDNKELVAYQDSQSNLYVSQLNNKYKTIVKIEDVLDYLWSDSQLIFSKKEGHIYQFDPKTKKVSLFLERTGYYYDELMINNQGILYAKKYVRLPKDYFPVGIVEYDSNSLEESILIAYEPVTKNSIGFDPSIVKLSPNGQFIYVWCRGNQDTADGVTLGVYNTVNNQLKQFSDFILLGYPDNLAISPTSTEVVGIISGNGRFMNENKQLKLLNIETEKLELITATDMAAMTPSFSQHGNKLFYSAGKAVNGEYTPFVLGTNHLYVYDLYTKLSTQLTEGNKSFDFYPQEIQNNELVFLRFVGKDKLNLMRRLADGKEITLLENINTDFQYYGHLDSYKILDVEY